MNDDTSSMMTHNESPLLRRSYARLLREFGRRDGSTADFEAIMALRRDLAETLSNMTPTSDRYGFDPMLHAVDVATEVCHALSPDPTLVAIVMFGMAATYGGLTPERIRELSDDDIAGAVERLMRVATLYGSHSTVKTDNFRNLMLAFAQDIRVIILMIIDRLVVMRKLNHHPDEELVREVAAETSWLYAPLAHRLGLYKIKSELEDLALKYTNRRIYSNIARELNAKKAARDTYIANFIAPVKARLEEAGLKFEIKGRPKSIASIWNKLKKQSIDVKDVFDLFAIRVILDSPPESDKEKAECWRVYSIITDMYTPNPARLKDWLSIPKSNGYESLHTTVQGPDGKWVEVQIRTRRMDLVAEKGLAAHWRYKGLKAEQGLDRWMNNIRDIIESGDADPIEMMKAVKMDVYDQEVFVFTPKGDLYKLPKGATILDLAFSIHSNLGCRCTGGLVNGRPRKINHKLANGDTVEILSAATQSPRTDWLNFVVTTKARSKIRQALKEHERRAADLGREILLRRLKNRKIEMSETLMARLIKQEGYKNATDFWSDLGREALNALDIIAKYESLTDVAAPADQRSAGEYKMMPRPEDEAAEKASDDVLVIGGGEVRGMKYRMARCCNPICGDEVFGFVSAEGVIKIHRRDCPNAADIIRKYPYRLIRTRWSGIAGSQMPVTLSVVGQDDLGIVTNITSVISKEPATSLRNIAIDTEGNGLFRGSLTVGISDVKALESLIKKIRAVKGVKDVKRIN